MCVRAFSFFPSRCRNQASVLRLEKQIPELLDKEVLEKKSVISFAFIKSTLNKRTVATFFSFQLE